MGEKVAWATNNRTASSCTIASTQEVIKDLLWFQYEVAPEWDRFCEFGPEDIGTVWEDIGAIRKKREEPSDIYVSPRVADLLGGFLIDSGRRAGLGSQGSVFKAPIHVSPFLSDADVLMIKPPKWAGVTLCFH